MVSLVCVLGIAGTFAWWRSADQNGNMIPLLIKYLDKYCLIDHQICYTGKRSRVSKLSLHQIHLKNDVLAVNFQVSTVIDRPVAEVFHATSEALEEKQMSSQLKTENFTRPEGIIAYDDNHAEEVGHLVTGYGGFTQRISLFSSGINQCWISGCDCRLTRSWRSSVDWDEYTLPASGQDIFALIAHFEAGPAHVSALRFIQVRLCGHKLKTQNPSVP